MVEAIQIVAILHVFFGMLWVGTSVYVDVAWYRPWRAIRTVGDLKVWQSILRPTGPFIGVSAISVIATGFAYMFMKYGTDFGTIWAHPSGRLILIALGIVIVAFVAAATGTNRLSIRLTRYPSEGNPEEPVPDEVHGLLDRIMQVSGFVTVLVVVVLILMVLAGTGGL